VASFTVFVGQCDVEQGVGHHHHKHHRKHHGRPVHGQSPDGGHQPPSVPLVEKESDKQPDLNHLAPEADDASRSAAHDEQTVSAVMEKMKKLENDLASRELTKSGFVKRSKIQVKGPLPSDFNERFQQAAASAVLCDPAEVRVTDEYLLNGNFVELVFDAPSDIAKAIEEQAINSKSNFTKGYMHDFLVQGVLPKDSATEESKSPKKAGTSLSLAATSVAEQTPSEDAAVAEPSGELDIDTEMPYGELEPFGREDTAQELTESSITESDEMVDQLERAEVAEEKRAVFRALTRLRGAAITSFDGVARSQTGNIDEYNKVHKWRSTHPLRHLASEEADVSKWAFPDTADF